MSEFSDFADSSGSDSVSLEDSISLVAGAGNNLETLTKRAQAKWLTTELTKYLCGICSPLHKRYTFTHFCCSDTLKVMSDGKVVAERYCKQRHCIVCNRIVMAKYIKAYEPLLSSWQDKQFLTLTVPNVKRNELQETVSGMLKNYSKACDSHRKAHKQAPSTLRKLECTYNARRNDYHPHLHVICSNQTEAQSLLYRWLKLYPEASELAQDIRPADEKSTKELFKYFAKTFAPGADGKAVFDPHAFDTMMCAIRGKQIFRGTGDAYGVAGKALKEVDAEVDAEQEAAEQDEHVREVVRWNQDHSDWFIPPRDVEVGYREKAISDYGVLQLPVLARIDDTGTPDNAGLTGYKRQHRHIDLRLRYPVRVYEVPAYYSGIDGRPFRTLLPGALPFDEP